MSWSSCWRSDVVPTSPPSTHWGRYGAFLGKLPVVAFSAHNLVYETRFIYPPWPITTTCRTSTGLTWPRPPRLGPDLVVCHHPEVL